MKRILLVEDMASDAEKVRMVLQTLQDRLIYSLNVIDNSAAAIQYLQHSKPDLILLDLEMRAEARTTMGLLDQIDPAIPIIVISNLSHYQKPSLQHQNVRGFIAKRNLQEYLPNCLMQIWAPKEKNEPETICFPTRSKSEIPEMIPIFKISFIELVARGLYDVHLTDKTVLPVRSVPFKELLRSIESQHILSLRPVSRNEIININNISSIYRNTYGRIELTLVGHHSRPFRPGKQWIRYYEETFL